MKTLLDLAAQAEIAGRLHALTPADQALWGRMSVHQMICHLREAYEVPLDGRPLADVSMPVPKPVMKFAALRIPREWIHGFKAPQEIAQDGGGAPPGVFDADLEALVAVFHRFCREQAGLRHRHPLFGPMQPWDWSRWGYLHADHHLRQFGR